MIAEPTLNAVRALLRARIRAASPHASSNGTVTVRVSEHPSLDEVGGVVRVDDATSGPLGIARIGRTSFVAYRLDADGLRQLPMEVDAGSGTLRVSRGH
jgi:hypothetical protein